jgi:hypothetical protein
MKLKKGEKVQIEGRMRAKELKVVLICPKYTQCWGQVFSSGLKGHTGCAASIEFIHIRINPLRDIDILGTIFHWGMHDWLS